MPYTVAGIDIHKKVLMVVVVQQMGGRTEQLNGDGSARGAASCSA